MATNRDEFSEKTKLQIAKRAGWLCGGAADAAARYLTEIDHIRDEHGRPDAEPRHPDLASGKAWPIMSPDPNATAD